MKRCKKWDHLWVPETFKHCFPERGGLKSIRPLEICLKVHPFMLVQAYFILMGVAVLIRRGIKSSLSGKTSFQGLLQQQQDAPI